MPRTQERRLAAAAGPHDGQHVVGLDEAVHALEDLALVACAVLDRHLCGWGRGQGPGSAMLNRQGFSTAAALCGGQVGSRQARRVSCL